MNSLKRAMVRKGQDAVVGMAAAVGLALLMEAGRRVFPSMTGYGSELGIMNLRWYLATKKGAPQSSVGFAFKEARMGYGSFVFQDAGHWFYAKGERAEKETSNSVSGGYVMSLYSLTGGQAAIMKLGENAMQYCAKANRRPTIYQWGGKAWTGGGDQSPRPRPLSSVVLQDDLSERLLRDLRDFLRDGEWYKNHYVPYRRGYLLTGPPGSGKTTLAGALAHELDLSVYILSLADTSLTDAVLTSALQGVHRGLLVLEDVDAVSAKVERRVGEQWISGEVDEEGLMGGMTYQSPGSLTLAGILNALDGLATPDGLMVIMTTNHPEKLDPALIRPGRVDVHAEIGLATRQQAHDLYLRFFPEYPENATRFAATITPSTLSPAAIQEHLVRHRFDPEGAAGPIQD